MVRTSMLPVRGISELSANPNGIRPIPPRLRSRRQIGIANKGDKCGSIRSEEFTRWQEVALNNCGIYSMEEVHLWRFGQRSTLLGILVKESQAFHTCRIEIVVNVVCEVAAYVIFTKR